VKRYLALLLSLGCGHSPTGIGESSRCQETSLKTTEAVRTFMVPGDSRVYALEIGVCSYVVDLPQAQVMDSIRLVFSTQNVVNRRVR
jgi:hypothetical protein